MLHTGKHAQISPTHFTKKIHHNSSISITSISRWYSISSCFSSLTSHNQLLRWCSIQDLYEMGWAYVSTSMHYWSSSVKPSQHHGWAATASGWKTAENLMLLSHASVAVVPYLFVVMTAFPIYLSNLLLFIAGFIKQQSGDHKCCECTTSSLPLSSLIVVSSSLHAMFTRPLLLLTYMYYCIVWYDSTY